MLNAPENGRPVKKNMYHLIDKRALDTMNVSKEVDASERVENNILSVSQNFAETRSQTKKF